MGLADRATRDRHQVSGGQRQRVGVALALALRPRVLLSDEATPGLDPDSTGSIPGLLRQLRDELDLSILLITHERDAVRQVAETVARLEGGRLTESGPVVDLLQDPRSRLGQDQQPRRTPTPPPPATASRDDSRRALRALAPYPPHPCRSLVSSPSATIPLMSSFAMAENSTPTTPDTAEDHGFPLERRRRRRFVVGAAVAPRARARRASCFRSTPSSDLPDGTPIRPTALPRPVGFGVPARPEAA